MKYMHFAVCDIVNCSFPLSSDFNNFSIFLGDPVVFNEVILNKSVFALCSGCKRDTVRVCCCAPCCGTVAAECQRLLLIDIFCQQGAQHSSTPAARCCCGR